MSKFFQDLKAGLPKTDNICFYALLILAIAANVLRFVHLDADFPREFQWSHELFTDEGWWASAAVRYHMYGDWYLDGDYNPVIFLPVMQMILGAVFQVTGVGIVASRATVATIFVLTLIVLYFLVKRYASRTTALFVIGLASVHFALFAYSRLTLLEVPMIFFVLVSVLFASLSDGKYGCLWTGVSALSFMAAFLTKSTALFILPVLLYLIWRMGAEQRSRRYAVFGGVLLAAMLAYYFSVIKPFENEYRHIVGLTLMEKYDVSAFDKKIENFLRVLFQPRHLDVLLYPAVIISLAVLPFHRAGLTVLRKNVLFVVSVAWLAAHLVLIGMNDYRPNRYFVPAMVPTVVLIALILEYLLEVRKRVFAGILVCIIALFVVVNTYKVAMYLQNPKYSFVEMAKDIKFRMDSGGSEKNLLLCGFGDSIALVTEAPSMNVNRGTEPLEYRVNTYSPTHYAGYRSIDKDPQILNAVQDREAVLIKKYDVFERPDWIATEVFFYRLIKKDKGSTSGVAPF